MHLTNVCVSHISSDYTWLPHYVDWGTDNPVQTLFETFYGKECATCHIKEGKFYLMFEGFYAVGDNLFSHCELIPIIFLTTDWKLTYSIFNWCLIIFFSGLGGADDFFFLFYKSLSSCWSIFQWAFFVLSPGLKLGASWCRSDCLLVWFILELSWSYFSFVL